MTQQELSLSDKKEVCKVALHRLIQVGLVCWDLGLFPAACLPNLSLHVLVRRQQPCPLWQDPLTAGISLRDLNPEFHRHPPASFSYDPIPSSMHLGHRTWSDEVLTKQRGHVAQHGLRLLLRQ